MNNPCGGTVGPDFERSFTSYTFSISAATNLPRRPTDAQRNRRRQSSISWAAKTQRQNHQLGEEVANLPHRMPACVSAASAKEVRTLLAHALQKRKNFPKGGRVGFLSLPAMK